MSNRNRIYTNEFKKDAISLALRSPTIKSAAKNLGIPEGTLNSWIRAATRKEGAANNNGRELAEELKKLRKENARLKEEREILKKFATFIAKEPK